ncbi:MAG: redox-sensing transcriptional repressor Rex [Planctomycetaceae bacterium]|jgi:redox-sensing transcriptional repressor|nr:redox-sensing transcriptional repressor Rex [Planctomycetaceae bacterium]
MVQTTIYGVIKNYPVPSIQRLPVYLRYLKKLKTNSETSVSCTKIADELGQLSVQVRKDLAITGITGRPKVGYRIIDLIEAIEMFLGWNRITRAFLVGAGSLGSAILGYQGFSEFGLDIVAAFDTDPNKLGTKIHGCPVHHTDELTCMGKDKNIDVGILTVPAAAAQVAADLLVNVGVRGIWNYTPILLELPGRVICEHVKLSASFAVLSCAIKNQPQ